MHYVHCTPGTAKPNYEGKLLVILQKVNFFSLHYIWVLKKVN